MNVGAAGDILKKKAVTLGGKDGAVSSLRSQHRGVYTALDIREL